MVKLTSRSERRTSRFLLEGAYTQEDGCFSLSYVHEGDRIMLRFSGDRATMLREGETTLEMAFAPNEQTQMSLAGQGLHGNVPVLTEKYLFIRQEKGYFFALSYTILYPQQEQKFLLKGIVISEEK